MAGRSRRILTTPVSATPMTDEITQPRRRRRTRSRTTRSLHTAADTGGGGSTTSSRRNTGLQTLLTENQKQALISVRYAVMLARSFEVSQTAINHEIKEV